VALKQSHPLSTCCRQSTCEGGTVSMSCSTGTYISVTWFQYGRWDGVTCGSQFGSTCCGATPDFEAQVLSKVTSVCNGTASCSFTASNTYFGLGDPCGGVGKYALYGYNCVAPSSPWPPPIPII
jgi:hypothetical protein